RLQQRDVALDLVVELNVGLRYVPAVLGGDLDLPAVDPAAGVEGLEEGLVAGERGLAEDAERPGQGRDVPDPDALAGHVDARSALDATGRVVARAIVRARAGSTRAERERAD